MYKELTFQTYNDRGVFLYTIGEGRDADYLMKTASTSFHSDISRYIENAKPIEGKTQVLLTSLGAGEYWGSNVNGDYFPQEALKHYGKDYGHKTFEYHAKVYKHHINKDPAKSYGDVVLAVWHDQMKRVELIVTIDHEKAPDLIERINNGEYPEVSMGCKVPFDVCSCCGNQAKTRAQYCDHLRYHMNKIPPGYNKKAYALNLKPKFFDISFVLVGADRIAKVMKKIAHVPGTSMEKTAFGLSRSKVAERKEAEIKKIVPSNTSPNTVKTLEEIGRKGSSILESCEKPIPKHIIIKITSSSTPGPAFLSRVLSSLTTAGIRPRPSEFQSIALRALGKPDLADEFERSRTVFDPEGDVPENVLSRFSNQLDLDPRHTDESIFRNLIPILSERSYSRPHLSNRVIRIVKLAEAGKLPQKEDNERTPVSILPMMGALTALYVAYGKKSPEALSKAERIIAQNPMIAAALGATMVGLTEGATALTGRRQKGKYDFNPDKEMTPNLSWSERLNMFNKNPITKTAKIPLAVKAFAGVPALYFLSGSQKIKHARNPQEEGFIGRTIRKNPDLLSLGLVGSHFLKKPNLLKGLKGLTKAGYDNSFSSIEKVSGLGEDMTSNMLFTMAFPGKSMIARSAGMMTDLGIMSAMEDIFSKQPKTPKTVGGLK